MEPKEFIFILWRYRLWAGLAFLITVAASVFAVWRMTPVYEATAKILIVQSDPTLRNLFEEKLEDSVTFARDSNPINTSSELLKTNELLQATIREAGLRNPKTGEELDYREFSEDMKVTPLKGTDLIKVSYQHTNPVEAARVLNILCRRYAGDNVTSNRKEATETLRFLEAQITEVRGQLERNDQFLERFKTQNRTFDLNAELQHASEGVSRLEGAAQESRIAIHEAQGRVRLLSNKLQLSPDQALLDVAISSHPSIQRLQAELVTAQTNPILTSGLQEDHPQIVAARAQIKRLDEAVADEAALIAGRSVEPLMRRTLDPAHEKMARDLIDQQITLISARVRQAALDAQRKAYFDQIKRLPKTEQMLAKLSRDREFNTELYKLLLKRREQARIAQAMSIGNVRVIQEAEVPKAPIKPNKTQSLVAAIMVGMILAAGLSIGLDHFDDTLRNEARTRDALATIPITGRIPARSVVEGTSRFRTDEEPLLNDPNVRAEAQDAYGLLRLDMVRRLGPQFKLMLAGVSMEEVAYYAANIALSFAQSGRRVLLVEGDMRNPTLHQYFSLDHSLDLRSLLTGEASWEDVATKVPHLPLWIIPTLESASSPLNLLDTPRLWALNQTISSFDVVLGIAPRVTAGPDVVALANLFNNLWLLLHHKEDVRADVSRSLSLLADHGLTVNGALFVNAREAKA